MPSIKKMSSKMKTSYKTLKWTKKMLNPENVENGVTFGPKTAEKLQFLDPEIEKMVQNIS